MLILHTNTVNPDSKQNWVMNSLLEGWPGAFTGNGTYFGQPAAFWGLAGGQMHLIFRHIDNAIPWWFWDMPFWGRWSRHSDEEHYWHAAYNNIYPTLIRDYPNDRWLASGKQLQPYRKTGRHILVAPSSETMTQFLYGISMHEWVTKTINEIQTYTDRPIHVRYKPRVRGMSGPDAEIMTGIGGVDQELEDCWCVITSVSLVAMDAQLQGIPTFCDSRSFAAGVSTDDLSTIENPRLADREPWVNWLGYNQFTENEISSGFAYEILSDYGTNPEMKP